MVEYGLLLALVAVVVIVAVTYVGGESGSLFRHVGSISNEGAGPGGGGGGGGGVGGPAPTVSPPVPTLPPAGTP